MMIADDNSEPLHPAGIPELIPEDHADAMLRFEAVRTLDSTALVGLEKRDLLLAWWSFCWLEAALHPDDAAVWPEEVADALPLAAEVFRRYEAGEIEDGEYYPAEAVRHLTRATELSPQLPAHRVELGFALLADGQRDAAKAAFEKALALPKQEKYDDEAHARARAALEKLR
jgi:tetratricopeptide (TPR) repeat protein